MLERPPVWTARTTGSATTAPPPPATAWTGTKPSPAASTPPPPPRPEPSSNSAKAYAAFVRYRDAGIGLGTTWPVLRSGWLGRLLPPLMRLDYIWHSAHFQVTDAQVGPALGSDHLPLIADLVQAKAL